MLCRAVAGSSGALAVAEADGGPALQGVTRIVVSNGTLSPGGPGEARLTFPSDIDGGNFLDGYINTADIDGGAF